MAKFVMPKIRFDLPEPKYPRIRMEDVKWIERLPIKDEFGETYVGVRLHYDEKPSSTPE